MIIIPRIARQYKNSPFLHIIVQGIKKEYIFKEEKYINKYLELFRKFSSELDINLIAYCIMSNHAHFLVKINEIEKLSKFMQKVNSGYAKYYNFMENGRVGYVFRDRYLSESIDSKRYFINCIKYIHFNPVKAGIVKNCKEYKYSSYREFIEKDTKKYEEQLKEILTKEEFNDICYNINYQEKFLDVNNSDNTEENIKLGIQEYIKIKKCKISDIFIERLILKELIKYLKEEHKIKYTETRKFFEIKKGTMEGIKTTK